MADMAIDLARGGGSGISGGRFSRLDSFSLDTAAFHSAGGAYDIEEGLGDRDMGGHDSRADQSGSDMLLEMAGMAAQGPALEPMGIVLLHPSLGGEAGPSFTRILGKSRYSDAAA